MLRRVMESRTEKCWMPSFPGGTRRSPVPAAPAAAVALESAPGMALPIAATPATPAAAPRNLRRLNSLSLVIVTSLCCPRGCMTVLGGAGRAGSAGPPRRAGLCRGHSCPDELGPVEVEQVAAGGAARHRAEHEEVLVGPAVGNRNGLARPDGCPAGRRQVRNGRDRPVDGVPMNLDRRERRAGGAPCGRVGDA